MKREIVITSDGSTTIYLPDWNENYHSIHGAIQEANHVFIKSGFDKICLEQKKESKANNISILEIGFGTALNCFITYLEALKNDKKIDYVGVEAYPVLEDEVLKLNYVQELKAEKEQFIFDRMHAISWDEKHQITAKFTLTKRKQFFTDINDVNKFDLIYFDAFAAEHQPDLWTEAIFLKMYNAIKKEGVLVTYCAKGSVRRAMQTVGFVVERLQGPPGKREMLRATKK